jgi:hypothetical protein
MVSSGKTAGTQGLFSAKKYNKKHAKPALLQQMDIKILLK